MKRFIVTLVMVIGLFGLGGGFESTAKAQPQAICADCDINWQCEFSDFMSGCLNTSPPVPHDICVNEATNAANAWADENDCPRQYPIITE